MFQSTIELGVDDGQPLIRRPLTTRGLVIVILTAAILGSVRALHNTSYPNSADHGADSLLVMLILHYAILLKFLEPANTIV